MNRKKYHFMILILVSILYLFNRFVFSIDSCHLNDFVSGIWLISAFSLYKPNVDIKFLILMVVCLAFGSEYGASLVKPTAVFDYMDIVVILVGGLLYCLFLYVKAEFWRNNDDKCVSVVRFVK